MKKISVLGMVAMGAILGTVVGALLQDQFSILRVTRTIGFSPTTFDLNAFKITLGLSLKLNLGSVLGGILGWFAYKKS